MNNKTVYLLEYWTTEGYQGWSTINSVYKSEEDALQAKALNDEINSEYKRIYNEEKEEGYNVVKHTFVEEPDKQNLAVLAKLRLKPDYDLSKAQERAEREQLEDAIARTQLQIEERSARVTAICNQYRSKDKEFDSYDEEMKDILINFEYHKLYEAKARGDVNKND